MISSSAGAEEDVFIMAIPRPKVIRRILFYL
jgi:hypothetical protein